MTDPWSLPTCAQIAGKTYRLHCDFRDILELMTYLQDASLPEAFRWHIALALFYEPEVPPEDFTEAAEYLSEFLCGGEAPSRKPGPKLLDWQQDAQLILSDVNKAAGRELRSEPFVHWWTFLSWFHAIGQGQLSAVVSIRDKLARGKALEGWEKDFYRQNRHRIDLKQHLTPQEEAEKLRLQALLAGGNLNKAGDGI